MNTDSSNSLRSRLRHRLRKERGAVLVEAAICIPILLLVILGAVEAGTAWEAKSSTVSGVRTGVLRASTIADRPETDMRIVQSVIGEIGADNIDGLEWIMIFDAEGDPDAQYNTCLGGDSVNPAGGLGCVVYGNAFIETISNTTDAVTFQATNFDTGIGATIDPVTGDVTAYSCDSTKVDVNWCAGQRTVGGDTQIGVAIRYTHDWTTGIFPFDSPVFQEYVISSTFAAGGSDIAPGTPAATPFAAGSIIPTEGFGAGFDFSSLGSNVSITSNANVVQSPNGEDFMGPYSTATITIDLENLTVGHEVCVSFDLYIIGSWDNGSNTDWGPDSFEATVGGVSSGETVYRKNHVSASVAEDSLGYADSSVVPMTVCDMVPASGEVSISFIGDMIQSNTSYYGTTDESWGIDNLQITTAP